MEEDQPITDGEAIWDQFQPEDDWPPRDELRGIKLALGGFVLLGMIATGGWWAWRAWAPVVVPEYAAEVLLADSASAAVALERNALALPSELQMPWLLGKSYLLPGEAEYAGNYPQLAAVATAQSQASLMDLAGQLSQPGTWLYKGELELAAGNYQQAQAAFENALALAPNTVHALSGLVRVLLVTNQLTAAAAPVALLAQQFPAHPGAAYVRALHARQSGDYELALTALTVILNRQPSHRLSILLLGDVQLARGNPERAQVNLNRYHNLVPDSLQGTNLLVRAYIDMEQPEKAAQLLLPLIDRMQQYPVIASNLAMAYTRMGKEAQAQAYQNLSLKLDAERVATENVLEYLGMAQSQAIFAEMSDAVSRRPETSDSQISLAISQLRRGGADAVSSLAQTLLLDTPGNSRLQYLFGRLAELLGDFTSATGHYRHALELDTDFQLVAQALARLEEDEGNLPAIAMRLEDARRSSDAALKPRLMLADVYLQQRKAELALAVSREIQALAPQSASGSYLLAAALVQSGDITGGVQIMEVLEPGHVDNLPLKWRMIEAYEWLGNKQALRESLERVFLVDDQNPRALAKLALLEQRDGNTLAAHALAERLKRHHPALKTGYLIESQLAMDDDDYLPAADLLEYAFRPGP